MKILIDMNLSPRWEVLLTDRGHEASHWSHIGDPRASDREIMDWARAHGYVVFTHDLDFTALLAASQADGPSILQIRTHNILPEDIGEVVLGVVTSQKDALESGAVVTVDLAGHRIRRLPIRPAGS